MTQALSRLGQREWSLIAIVVLALVAALWYTSFISPMQTRITEVQAEVDDLSTQRDIGRRVQAGLPEIRRTVAQLEIQRQDFLRRLPTEEQLTSILNSLSSRARDTGVEIRSLTRAPITGGVGIENVGGVNIALQLEAPFAEMFSFIRQLEGLQRFSTISGLSFNLSNNSTEVSPLLNVSMTITFYTLLTPAGGQQ